MVLKKSYLIFVRKKVIFKQKKLSHVEEEEVWTKKENDIYLVQPHCSFHTLVILL